MFQLNSASIYFFKYVLVFLITVNFYVESDESTDGISLKFYQKRDFHKPTILTKQQSVEIAAFVDENRFKDILNNILVVRDVGSEGHEIVKNYIVNFLRKLDWDIELDEFHQYIPTREKNMTFSTIISRLNKDAERFLVLACHYDSKYMGNQKFYAATDSAVPCAMLLDMAVGLKAFLKKYQSTDLSLMFIFFDGEEAFGNWGPTDSIYGAKHLARRWESSFYEKDGATQMQRIDVLMLLDLLGTKDPRFYYYSPDTKHLHYLLSDTENKLHQLDQLDECDGIDRYFIKKRSYRYIEDDHLPFMRSRYAVPILHIIPDQFPSVWHTLRDNYDALDFPTITNLNKIFYLFTLSYLSGSFDEQEYQRVYWRSSIN